MLRPVWSDKRPAVGFQFINTLLVSITCCKFTAMKSDRSSFFHPVRNFRSGFSVKPREPLRSTPVIWILFAIVLAYCDAVSAGEFSLSAPVLFQGAVDCSAAADVGDGFFAGATDEENELRSTMSKAALN